MTEDEAKTKWCPMARHTGSSDDRDWNRWYRGNVTDRCLGSECMAWRKVSDDYGTRSDDGYCGLAGQP